MGRTKLCVVLVAHARRHAIVHQLLLFCACDVIRELDEIVNTPRSSRSGYASINSLFSLGNLTRRGDGDEVDAEHKPSPDPPESLHSARLTAPRGGGFPVLGSVGS